MKKEYIVLEEIDFLWDRSDYSGITFHKGNIIELEFNNEINAWIYVDEDGDVYWQYNYSIEDKIKEISNKQKEQRILDNVRGYTKDWEEGIITDEEYSRLINKEMFRLSLLEKKEEYALDAKTIINNLTVYEFLTELSNEMLDELHVMIEEVRDMRMEPSDMQRIINMGQYTKSRNSREE